MTDLVSVIIPTYNRNRLLFGRSLPSALVQTYRPIEVLIIADGMEGDQLEELEEGITELRVESDCPIKLWNIDRPPYPEDSRKWGSSGVVARNFGLDHARGKFIACLDDDDEMLPETISVLHEAIGTLKADFVYGMSRTFKGDPPVDIGQRYGHWPPGDGAITHGAFLYRAGDYRYDLTSFERGLNPDADMWLRMYAGGVKFEFLPLILHNYYRNWP